MFRLSGKKLLLYSTLLGSGLLLVLCFQNKFQVSSPRSSSGGHHHNNHNNAKTKTRRLAEQNLSSRTINSILFSNSSNHETTTKSSTTTTTAVSSSSSQRNNLVRNTTEFVEQPDRPWYMLGGNQRPSFSSEQLPIFPEDQFQSDRIPGLFIKYLYFFSIGTGAMSKQYWEV